MARVRLEPLGETIECAPGETVLDAAFRQGYNLAHGCREGQCSACKCQVISGDVDLKPYSTFALSDTELESGYALMCRAIPQSDLELELLHLDPDAVRLEHPIRTAVATVRAVRELTPDIVGLTLRVEEPADFAWRPGQYIDLHVPGSGDPPARRSFSIATLPGSADAELELIIKRYPGGRLSGMLGDTIVAGSPLSFTGPYGTFGLRESDRPILLVAGGSGLGPVLAVLRELAERGCERPVRLWYGARTASDLFATEEINALGEKLADFRYAPVVGGFVHEAIDEELADPDVYMCGPPPMLEAVEALMVGRGVDPERIVQDRFTTSAAAAPGSATAAPAAATAAPGAPGPESDPDAAPRADPREFTWFSPAARRATLYEDVTVDTQPSVHRHLTRGWPLSFEDGRGTWNDASTAVTSSDWFAFRDPAGQWERPFYQLATARERGLEGAVRLAAEQGLLDDISPAWVQALRSTLQIPAFVEHGLWFALATAARDCLSDSVATCVCLQAAMKQRSAQAIVLHAMDLEAHLGIELPIEPAREAFLSDPAWQPTRRYLERLAATADWVEVVVAVNLCFEPVLGTLLRREHGTRRASAQGDVVTPGLARAATEEWEWVRDWTIELTRFLIADPLHGEANRARIVDWISDWRAGAEAAAEALGADLARLRGYADSVIADALSAPAAPAPSVPDAGAAVGAADPSAAPGGGPGLASGDVVGIVMAKSAEGDAVARYFSGRAEVLEQPAFWEIRSENRLVLRYAELSDELGYRIDAYSIQHEMSTHYGRMVATDDALMLFADPTEAMEHLLT